MANIDTSLWDNIRRMRERMNSLAKMVLTLALINLYPTIASGDWLFVAMNIIWAISTIPLFISYAKWQKQPPKEIIKEEGEKE